MKEETAMERVDAKGSDGVHAKRPRPEEEECRGEGEVGEDVGVALRDEVNEESIWSFWRRRRERDSMRR